MSSAELSEQAKDRDKSDTRGKRGDENVDAALIGRLFESVIC